MAIELASAYVSLVPSAKGLSGKIGRELGGPLEAEGRRAGDRAGKGFLGRFGVGLKGLAGVAAGAFAGIKVAGFIGDTISAASDLSETTSKVKVVFGEAAQGVLNFGQTSATALGQSKNEALAAAGTFGNLLRAVGLSEKESAKFSTSMVTLASDLASFNNTSPTEALDALRAGLVGETEPLKRFGVNLNEATLKAKALALGLADGKKPLDANAKAQAAYALIMEQTSLAQGDFARTSDGLANKQRILSARFEDIKATLGQKLLPVATKVVSFFADKLPVAIDLAGRAFGRIRDFLTPIIANVRYFAEILVAAFRGEEMWTGGDRLVELFVTIGQGARELADLVRNNFKEILLVLGAVIAGFVVPAFVAWATAAWAAATAQVAALAPGIALAAAIAALAAAVIYAYKNFEGFRSVVDGVAKWLVGTAWPAIQRVVQGVVDSFADAARWARTHWAAIQEAIGHVLVAVEAVIDFYIAAYKLAWRLFGDEVLALAKGAWDAITGVIEGAVKAIQGIIEFVLAVINGDWGEAWDALKKTFAGVWDAIVALLTWQVTAVKQILSAALSAIGAVWAFAWGGIKTGFSAIWEGIKSIVKGAIDFVLKQIDRALGPLDEILAKAARFGIATGRNSRTQPQFSEEELRRLGGNARGTPSFRGGWTVAGEEGPELINLPRGTAIFSHQASTDMLSDVGRAGGIHIGQVVVDESVDLWEQLRRAELLANLAS